MAIDLSKLEKKKITNRMPKLGIYGPPGVGKSTVAASAEDSVVLATEPGMDHIECVRLLGDNKKAESLSEVSECLNALMNQEHSFKWLIIDTIDWLEPLIIKHICESNGVEKIEAIKYGQGYVLAEDIWRKLFDDLDYLTTQGVGIILVGHSQVEKINSPIQDPYDRYSLKLNKKSNALIDEWADLIGFIDFKMFVRNEESGFGKKTGKGIGTGERVLHVDPSNPAFQSKSRIENFPKECLLDWEIISQHLNYKKGA